MYIVYRILNNCIIKEYSLLQKLITFKYFFYNECSTTTKKYFVYTI